MMFSLLNGQQLFVLASSPSVGKFTDPRSRERSSDMGSMSRTSADGSGVVYP